VRALDTNILVRFVANDDGGQIAAAEHLFEESQQNREHLFVSTPVMCELVWVLKNGLKQDRPQIVKVIDSSMEDALFQIEHKRLVFKALDRYRHGKADFADYLIGQLDSNAGCRDTVTFEKALKNAPGFTLL
jgi:predicted nucleic-acid-binding protein